MSVPRFIAIGLASLLALPTTGKAQEASDQTKVQKALLRKRERVRSLAAEPTLTNDWFGAGPWLDEHGIHFEAALTGFFQESWSGSGQDLPGDGGKLDALLRLNGEKLGLWKGLSLTAHSEYNFGQSLNGRTGTILPVNLAMQLPGATSGTRYDTSSLFLTQRFNDTFSLIIGKTNLADLAALHPYAGGAGLTGFMNGGLASAPNGMVPPYVYGGALIARTRSAVWSFSVYGATPARDSLDFGEAFDDGQLFSASVNVPVKFRGQPGNQSLTVSWGDREIGDLTNVGDLLAPGAIQGLDSIDSKRLLIRYAFHQQLGTWGGDPDRGWGVWARAQWTDQDLTPVAWSVAGGIGGTSPLCNREHDRWGIGAFYFSFSDYLKDDRIVTVPLEDEFGAEIFYRSRLFDGISVTADLQVVDPGIPAAELAVVGGLRTMIRF